MNTKAYRLVGRLGVLALIVVPLHSFPHAVQSSLVNNQQLKLMVPVRFIQSQMRSLLSIRQPKPERTRSTLMLPSLAQGVDSERFVLVKPTSAMPHAPS